jgi:Holliday junction resolvasome RuvABC endonuclease subunit
MPSTYPRTVLGIDPGTANIGFALVRKDSARAKPRLLALDYVGTTKGKGPVVADDVRRLRLAIDGLRTVLANAADYGVFSVAVEWYAPRGRQRNGWKTALTVGAVLAVAEFAGVPVTVQAAKDRAGASKDKQKVIAAMKRRVTGFAASIERWPATKHEHLADACAHALTSLERTK